MPHFDVIVIGTGGIGSAALYQLAKRGARVLGLDRFPPGHDRGSTHGQTRIIRQAYYEHPDYVPLLHRAYGPLWAQLEHEAAEQLYFPVGLLEIGYPDGKLVPGVLTAAEQHRLPIEQLTAPEVNARWHGAFVMPEGMHAVYEEQAGYLRVEACVLAQATLAQRAGATIRSGETVQQWSAEGSGVRVETDVDSFTADRLIITAGAWANDLLANLGVPLEVRRKPLCWFACDDPRYRADAGCPAYLFELPGGSFYGFPSIDGTSLKAAEHTGGDIVTDPLNVDRTVHNEDVERVAGFLHQCLPGVSGELVNHSVCLYTLSPDTHFLVDRHPAAPQVSFVAGLSGHGYKFATVLGEVMANFALEGAAKQPVKFLSIDRFKK